MNPLDEFVAWYQAAKAAGVAQPEAMTLATATAEGRPSARVVLYRGTSQGGVRFFTNQESRKGQELDRNPHAALVFHWEPLERQVRIEGAVQRLDDAENDAYFLARPRGHQIAAWASPQSRPLTRAELEQRFREAEARFDNQPVERPPHWGGYRVVPSRFEFWTQQANRLHIRRVFTRHGEGWREETLAAVTAPAVMVGRDARVLMTTRGLRGFADGVVSVTLASHLKNLGFSTVQVGVLVTGTLLGSAALTLASGLWSHRWERQRLLAGAALLMIATGLGFAGITSFWPLFVVAVVGTVNPSAGDVSVFLPTEQALLADAAGPRERTRLFALYNLSGTFAGALGALACGLPFLWAARHGWSLATAHRTIFFTYGAVGLLTAILYRSLSPGSEGMHPEAARTRTGLVQARGVVLRLAALFSLDALGGGFVVQSLLALWLYQRFHLSIQTTGTIFFATGLLSALSQLLSVSLTRRIGHINTMVFTHLPANIFLILTAVMPSAPWAVTCLLARMALSQMDVPARQSYVMAVVPPEERAAAASVTNVPRSLAAATTPLLASVMLAHSDFGWPLVCGGLAKIVYDLLLLAQFRKVKPLG